MIFGIKEKVDNFDPYNVFLAFATNISVTYDWFCGPRSIYMCVSQGTPYAHQGWIYLIKNAVKNCNTEKYYYSLKNCFLFEYILKCN